MAGVLGPSIPPPNKKTIIARVGPPNPGAPDSKAPRLCLEDGRVEGAHRRPLHPLQVLRGDPRHQLLATAAAGGSATRGGGGGFPTETRRRRRHGPFGTQFKGESTVNNGGSNNPSVVDLLKPREVNNGKKHGPRGDPS